MGKFVIIIGTQWGDEGKGKVVDIITPHITDSYHIEYPCLNSSHGFACEAELPHWPPVRIGGMELELLRACGGRIAFRNRRL